MANTRNYGKKRRNFQDGGSAEINPATGLLANKPLPGVTAEDIAAYGRTEMAPPRSTLNQPVEIPESAMPRLRTGRGTARVDAKKYPGWPTM